ncbi:MAG: Rpn family recombination-promoting nuclease/putative transposase [Treponema sp.]|jgi:predicted transposase/invertase (TIGR01784 family)|nr:Rpn family recombination-promoting nuclease/putative transposase [Treponema sp.]
MTETNNEQEGVGLPQSGRRIKPLNDFAFQKGMGEIGDEVQLLSHLSAILERTDKGNLQSVEIIEKKDLAADVVGGKYGKLDVLAKLANGARVNIEVQIKNEYNIEKRTLYYWGSQYRNGFVTGQHYEELLPVITINIIEFSYFDIEDFHTSYHLWEDRNKDKMLSDVCEIHFLDMIKFRKLRRDSLKKLKEGQSPTFSLDDPLHRWLAYFDDTSSSKLIEEVLGMDSAIQAFQSKLDLIERDPDMLRTYEQFAKAASDYTTGMAGAERKGERRKALEAARNGKAIGVPIEQIAKMTGLTIEEVWNL